MFAQARLTLSRLLLCHVLAVSGLLRNQSGMPSGATATANGGTAANFNRGVEEKNKDLLRIVNHQNKQQGGGQ